MNINMNTEMVIALSSAFVSLTGTLFAIFSHRRYRLCRTLLEFTAQQSQELDDSVANLQESLEEYKQKTTDQSRRIAWLESRIRQPKPPKEEVIDDTAPAQPVKWNMTERRHRVLMLAGRGQATDRIAATLGMMPGEVELIINLNRANFAPLAHS